MIVFIISLVMSHAIVALLWGLLWRAWWKAAEWEIKENEFLDAITPVRQQVTPSYQKRDYCVLLPIVDNVVITTDERRAILGMINIENH